MEGVHTTRTDVAAMNRPL